MYSELGADACRGPLHRLRLGASGSDAAKHKSVQTIAGSVRSCFQTPRIQMSHILISGSGTRITTRRREGEDHGQPQR